MTLPRDVPADTSPVVELNPRTDNPVRGISTAKLAMSLGSAILWPVVAFLVILGLWQVIIALVRPNTLLLPAPHAVWHATLTNHGLLLSALGATLWASVLGFLIAITAGVLLAILIVSVVPAGRILWPALTVVNAAPKVVIAPIFAIWFGIGFSSKVALAALLSFFPIVINAARGLADVDPELLEFWQLLRASKRQILWRVRLPNCLPHLYDGGLVALPIAIVGTVIAEFVASDNGIGHLIIVAYSQFDTATVFAATIAISLLSTVLFLLLKASEPIVVRWSPTRR